jgi:beta-glucosidase
MSFGLAVLVVAFGFGSGASGSVVIAYRTARRGSPSTNAVNASCPWTNAQVEKSSSPSTLANEVLAKMTLAEKATFVVLRAQGGYENTNGGVPSLCIPPLTMQDGPNGIAFHARGVTELPASLGVAATFDPSLAFAYGQVLGAEARDKGIDAVQGPNLNLARVPESGRIFEGYGEDPYLVSVMGDADIEGIQSEGIMADAKHFTAYNQETARSVLDEAVSTRALEELYLAPFESAVKVAHVASLMCAFGSINAVNDCSDPVLYKTLYKTWNFTGFVRSDLGAVRNLPAGFDAGLSLVKPASPTTIIDEVEDKQLKMTALNDAIRRVLTEMFAFGLIDHPLTGSIDATASSPAHASVALSVAEQSIVLLKNSGVLPLSRRLRSVALIGTDAGAMATTTGHGSARVIAPFLITPSGAIARSVSSSTQVSYAPGGPADRLLPEIPRTDYLSGAPLPEAAPLVKGKRGEPGKSDLGIISSRGVTRAVATADRPLKGPYPWRTWSATIAAPQSGLYEISLTENGDTWFSINGRDVLSFRGLHGHYTWTTAVNLVGGRPYDFELDWFQTGRGNPRLGFEDVTPDIDQAVATAKASSVAVVFVSDYNGEGLDRPNLSLPGDENALIEAVAKVNARTVVVLNTGGAVLMPWLGHVAAVIEAWYPGEEDGNAAAAVLFGSVDPSGRLPLTFPSSDSAVPASTAAQWPGVDDVVSYKEGLDIGYRWYEATKVKPLFAFGFGLSYTSFRLGALHLQREEKGDEITLVVTNTGRRLGTAVLQCYLEYPKDAGEPSRELRAFTRVTLRPGMRRTVRLSLTRPSFEAFLGGRFIVPRGGFVAWVGTSSSDLPEDVAVLPPSP